MTSNRSMSRSNDELKSLSHYMFSETCSADCVTVIRTNCLQHWCKPWKCGNKKKKKVPQCGKGRSGLICGATEFPLIPMDWRAALPAGWQTDEKKWSQYDSKNRGTKPRLKISRNIQWLTGKDDRFFTVRWFCSTVHTEVIVPLKRSGCVSMLWAMLWINEQDYFTTILNI